MNKLFSMLGVFFCVLISYLPFSLLYVLSDFLYLLVYKIIGYRKKVVRENLRNSFPNYSELALLKIEKQFYHYLCDTILETTKLISISKSELRKRVKVKNSERFYELIKEGKNISIVFGHFYNWEWLAAAIHTNASQLKIFGIYKPLSNKAFDKMFFKMRSRSGLQPVPMQTAMRTIIKDSKNQFGVILISDQTPSNVESSYWANFLNQPTPIFLGTEKISEHFNNSVVFVDVTRVKRGFLEIEFVILTESTKDLKEFEVTELHTRYLEKRIIENPAYWLWSHRRWKHKPTKAIKEKFNLL